MTNYNYIVNLTNKLNFYNLAMKYKFICVNKLEKIVLFKILNRELFIFKYANKQKLKH